MKKALPVVLALVSTWASVASAEVIAQSPTVAVAPTTSQASTDWQPSISNEAKWQSKNSITLSGSYMGTINRTNRGAMKNMVSYDRFFADNYLSVGPRVGAIADKLGASPIAGLHLGLWTQPGASGEYVRARLAVVSDVYFNASGAMNYTSLDTYPASLYVGAELALRFGLGDSRWYLEVPVEAGGYFTAIPTLWTYNAGLGLGAVF